MLKRSLIFITLSFFVITLKAQSLSWHLTAQAGTANYQFENFQGAFLAGFKNPDGQQLSFGPVVKGYNLNNQFTNVLGGRIYSQAKVYRGISLYLQCDVFDGVRSQSLTTAKSPMRLETGAGVIYTYREKIGLSAGYNLGELNPVSGIRKNIPSVKLVYLIPFSNNSSW